MLLARKCTERWNLKNLAFPVRRASYICSENREMEYIYLLFDVTKLKNSYHNQLD